MSSNHSMVTNLDQVPSYWLETETIKLAGSRDETNFGIPSTQTAESVWIISTCFEWRGWTLRNIDLLSIVSIYTPTPT